MLGRFELSQRLIITGVNRDPGEFLNNYSFYLFHWRDSSIFSCLNANTYVHSHLPLEGWRCTGIHTLFAWLVRNDAISASELALHWSTMSTGDR